MDAFWFDILKSVTSGLATGLILVFVGLGIWKYQLRYTKKFDVYIKSLANVSQIKTLVETIRSPLRQFPVKDYYQLNKDLFEKLERNKFEFMIYFGKEYKTDFDLFSTTMNTLLLFDNEFQQKVLVSMGNPEMTRETIYGSNNPNDAINLKMNLSFQRIESALKKKKSGKK